MNKKVAVIGGGASGMMAAIEAARNGAQVTIYEHTDRLGKKILATGNGKCNLGNRYMEAECFQSACKDRVTSCLNRFSTVETISFFEGLGLCLKEKNGYLYPLSEQAAVVLDVLRLQVEQAGIQVIYGVQVQEILPLEKSCPGRKVFIKASDVKAYYDAVILACGGKASPKTGSDGSGYALAKQLGHKILPVLPSLVQLKCSDSFCKAISGIRADARVHIYDGITLLCEEQGELQLTDYGISGIPVFQLSGEVNRYLYKYKNAALTAKIDFLPFMGEERFRDWVNARMKQISTGTVEEFFLGILNKKLMTLFIKQVGLRGDMPIKQAKKNDLWKVFELCKGLKMHIAGSNGFDNAQVCTGGVDLCEVTDDLESVYAKNVYFAGEILDVDGRCGGYNLQWAWTSGAIAGRAAADRNS